MMQPLPSKPPAPPPTPIPEPVFTVQAAPGKAVSFMLTCEFAGVTAVYGPFGADTTRKLAADCLTRIAAAEQTLTAEMRESSESEQSSP